MEAGDAAATLQVAEVSLDVVDGEGRCISGLYLRLLLRSAERIPLGGNLMMPYSLRSMIRSQSRTSGLPHLGNDTLLGQSCQTAIVLDGAKPLQQTSKPVWPVKKNLIS